MIDSEKLQGFVRHGLTVVGSVFATLNIGPEREAWEALGGALAVVVAFVWSWKAKTKKV